MRKAYVMLHALERFEKDLDDSSSAPMISEYMREIKSLEYLKKLFITRQAHIGLGPAATRPGDRVSLLYKTSCPMVLRPQNNFYRIVRGSYMAALARPRTKSPPFPLNDLTSGAIVPEMIEIR